MGRVIILEDEDVQPNLAPSNRLKLKVKYKYKRKEVTEKAEYKSKRNRDFETMDLIKFSKVSNLLTGSPNNIRSDFTPNRFIKSMKFLESKIDEWLEFEGVG